ETSSPVHIELTGADGRVIMQTTALGNNVTLDLDNLSPGIYVLSVKGNSFLHRQTVIKTE
ncbi:MAG: T9SS type A sorting domain-containing protein, partial [Bacteroidales bacterium]|nr:T9SS type A sorting domain-containing protein [Bacteroidales bacterium]